MALKVFFETYGCQMNVTDTEKARQLALESGLELASDTNEADVIMLNTCSIRAKAERKAQARVHELDRDKGNKKQVYGVMGCVAQLEGENLFERNSKVSLVVGTQAIKRLPELVENAYRNDYKLLDLGPGVTNDEKPAQVSVRHSGVVAFVPIIEGCNKFCSYCVVPYSRGRERSRSLNEILAEVKQLKSEGVKEIHLIGQNVNSYRPASDNELLKHKGATPFSKLLRAVAQTEMPRIKFTTSFPRDFHQDIVEAINEHQNLCNWIHLPVQSGSNKILKDMRRGYSREEYLDKIEKIRGSGRNISITTDIIIGYPTESPQDFRETFSLVKECSFDNAYIFKYSPRRGTPSYLFPETLTSSEKQDRFNEIDTLQRNISTAKAKTSIDHKYTVLAEKQSVKNPADFMGHTTCHKVVNFQSSTTKLGDLVEVVIKEVKTNSFYGTME